MLVHAVGRTPWSAADAPVGVPSFHELDFVGERAGPGGPPHIMHQHRENEVTSGASACQPYPISGVMTNASLNRLVKFAIQIVSVSSTI